MMMRRTTRSPSDPAAASLPFWCLMPKGVNIYLSCVELYGFGTKASNNF
jgi:hypothetical protein